MANDGSSNQRGAGNFKLVATLAIVALLIFLSIKLGPPYFSDYELKEDLDSIARLATYAQNKTPDDIKKDIIAKAKEDDVELTEEQVEVERTPNGVNLAVKYSVHVEILGQSKDLKFSHTAGNKNITAK
jgi:ABC-type transport system involved in cytochrome bd biosynthesis fused ATPase/permease subunit